MSAILRTRSESASPQESSPSMLKGELGAFQYFTLCFGAVIGVGWMPLVGVWIANAGSFGAALGFIFGGSLICIVLASYIRVAEQYPVSGGEVAYAWEIFGPKAGFLVGWMLSFSYLAIGGFMAITAGWITGELVPMLVGEELYTVFGGSVKSGALWLGLIVSVLLAWLHIRGATWVAQFQNVMTVGLIAASAIFVAGGLIGGDASNLDPKLVITTGGASWAGIVTVFATTPLFYGGFNFAVQAIGERSSKTPVSRIGLALVAGVACACLFYVAVIMSTAMAMPRSELLLETMPAAAASRRVFGASILADLVLVAGLLGIVTSWNAVILAAARILHFMAQADQLPSILGRTHAKFGSPHVAILFVTAIGALACAGGVGLLGPIVGAAGAAIAFAYVIVAFGALRLKSTAPGIKQGFVTTQLLRIAPFAAVFAFLAALFEPFLSDWSLRLPLPWRLLGGWVALGLLIVAARKARSCAALH
ncbi:MAG TPA: APC family permease [Steroidobacter sp.]